ncbi:MAG: DNA translocase FtsK [Phycisphaerales bacterium]|nr:DNA translocase FtsK [Phycisphaerales bacterium]
MPTARSGVASRTSSTSLKCMRGEKVAGAGNLIGCPVLSRSWGMARTSPKAVARTGSTSTSAGALPPASITVKLVWLVGAATWLYLAASLASFSGSDWPSHSVAVPADPPANLGGTVGAAIAYGIYESVGYGFWIPMLCAGYALGVVAMGQRVPHPAVRAIGALLAMCAFGGLHALWFPTLGVISGAEAGLVPGWMAEQLGGRFGGLGGSLVLIVALLIGLLVAVDEIMMALPAALVRAAESLEPVWAYDYKGLWNRIMPAKAKPALAGAMADGDGGTATATAARSRSRRIARNVVDLDDGADEAARPLRRRSAEVVEEAAAEVEDEMAEASEDGDPDAEAGDADDSRASAEPERAPRAAREKATPSPAEAEEPASRAPLSAEELRERISKLPVRMSTAPKTLARDEDIPREADYTGYQFPTLEMLDDPEGNYSERMENFVREQAGVLTETLRTYQIDGEVVGIESGPVVTLYSVELASGTRVARLETISKDIARALKAPNIRIIANMTGKTAVGIEVPNPLKEKVRLKELMSGGQAEGMRLPMFLGKDSSGEPLVLDLARMPHMLIAGTTGSGKSVCINTILMSWLYTKRPDELKLVLVDPKMVEMSMFADIPHLMAPVVTDMNQAAGILEWVVGKMEERYELFKSVGVRDIVGYNELGEEELYARLNPQTDLDRARIAKKIPYMVFVIDELADLIMTNKEVETHIVRIAQKARAVGIHLVLATQRPQANVVTGLIKANMPCRIAFKVASGMDSRIVLDQKGAELLLGQGDMMVLTPSSSELRRSQGTLVTDSETRKVVRFLKDVATPSFERALLAVRSSAGGGSDPTAGGELAADERDPLFDKAVEIMIETGRGSVSLLQRRLAIGYGRASRLVDQMALAGIVSDHKGSVAREVMITLEDWQRMKAMEEGEGGEGSEDGEYEAAASSGDDSDDED